MGASLCSSAGGSIPTLRCIMHNLYCNLREDKAALFKLVRFLAMGNRAQFALWLHNFEKAQQGVVGKTEVL